MIQAIRMALRVGESRLGVTDIFGEDVGPPLGGVFTGTQGLETAWNTPLDERGIVGTAIGLALAGRRPVAEIQFCDYAFNTIDLLKLAGNTYWSSGGDWNVPLVMMTPVGAGIRGSIYHSHSFDATATRIPGWKIVMPSTPRDAYGLMLTAIVDPNPVMFLMPKALLRMKSKPGEGIPGAPDDDRLLSSMIDAPLGDRSAWKPTWPELEELYIPIGEARVARPGTSRCASPPPTSSPPTASTPRSSTCARSTPTTGPRSPRACARPTACSASTRTPRSRTSAST
jgi:2-oxoisovalerate dehydrogenase E1 component beta subunit